MDHFQSLLNLLQYCFCFMFWIFLPRGIWYLIYPTKDWIPTAYIGGQNHNHWTTREVPDMPCNFVVVVVIPSHDVPGKFSSVQLLSCLRLFATPWTEACQACLSITNIWSLLKFMSTELEMPSNHLILCCPLTLLPLIFSSIRVFSNESVLHMRWPKYWSFRFSISPSNEY